MTTKLRSKYWSNHHGAGRITVYGAGHQLTVPYDHAATDPHLVAVANFTKRFHIDGWATEVERDARGAFPNTRYWTISEGW